MHNVQESPIHFKIQVVFAQFELNLVINRKVESNYKITVGEESRLIHHGPNHPQMSTTACTSFSNAWTIFTSTTIYIGLFYIISFSVIQYFAARSVLPFTSFMLLPCSNPKFLILTIFHNIIFLIL